MTDESIIALAHYCPLILEFDLQNLPEMTDKSMREIWLHSVYLRELRLTGNENITAAGFPLLNPSRTGIKTVEGSGNSLNSFSESDRSPRPIDGIYYHAPKAEHFAYLRTVDLTGCAGITDEAIASLISAAPKIRALTLAKCVHLTDAAIESVAKLGKQLHYFHAAHLIQ